MAQVTVELYNLLKTDFELFDFEYEFADENFKHELEQAVIDFYYFYEINGSPDFFKHTFKRRWLSMIDYYNELYKTTLLEYNPLVNHSMTEKTDQLNTSNSTQDMSGNSTSYSDSNVKGSDYPQQPIAGGDYLSEESKTTVDSEVNDSTKTVSSNTNEISFEKTVEGITGITYPELIRQHRESLIRIKSMVIAELKPCFLLVH